MSRRETARAGALVCLALSFASACGTRDVALDIHTPAQCCRGEGCVEPECPLARVGCVRTSIELVDGTLAHAEDEPAELCRYEDLAGFVFLDRVMQPSDAVDVRIEGRAGAACEGDLVFTCESFGEHVIDLERDTRAGVFCECPR